MNADSLYERTCCSKQCCFRADFLRLPSHALVRQIQSAQITNQIRESYLRPKTRYSCFFSSLTFLPHRSPPLGIKITPPISPPQPRRGGAAAVSLLAVLWLSRSRPGSAGLGRARPGSAWLGLAHAASARLGGSRQKKPLRSINHRFNQCADI